MSRWRPKGNVMARNICGATVGAGQNRKAEPYSSSRITSSTQTRGSSGGRPPTSPIADDSPAKELGFCPIPLDESGVYASDDRASWPVVHTLYPAPEEARK